MGCGVSQLQIPRVQEEGGYDLKQIYQQWARYMFTVNGKFKSRYQIEVNDEAVHYLSGETQYTMEPAEKPVTRVMYTGVQHIKNKEDQLEFSFKNERKTKSVASIHLTQNLVRNGQGLGIPLQYPALDACSGFGQGTVLSGKTRQTEEHEFTWGLDNVIKARSPGKRGVDLRVVEKHLEGTFSIEVAFRGPLIANLWDVSSGNKLWVSNVTGRAEDVLFKMAAFSSRRDEVGKRWARYTMKGSCEFKYAIEQHVVVHKVVEEEGTSDSESNTEY